MLPLPSERADTEMAAASVAVPRSSRPAYIRLASPAASDSAYFLPDQRVGPVDHLEARRGGGAGSHHRDEEVREARAAPGDDDASRQRAVPHGTLHVRPVRQGADDDVAR